jgi:hypothetical protein
MKILNQDIAMKTILSITYFLLIFKLSAQDSAKMVVFINPYYTNDKNDNEFKITNHNSEYPSSINGRFEDPIKTTYFNVNADVKVYLTLKANFIIILQAGIGKSNYFSTIAYTKFLYRDINGNNIFENRESKETITNEKFNFQYGLGKKFVLDKNKKLSLVLETLFFANISNADKEIYDIKVGESKNFSFKYYYNNYYIGGKCNLAINYQMFKHFGIGLALNDLITAYEFGNKSNENYYINNKETIFNIGQLSIPVLSLIWFL